MPKKVRELKQTVTQSGFVLQKKRGKGSHTFWIHPLLPFMPLTIPGKDGDNAPRYLEKQVQEALQALQKIQEDN
jgi:predicted RNA binding protein YcfA (HicA-like mRNA interferase family)